MRKNEEHQHRGISQISEHKAVVVELLGLLKMAFLIIVSFKRIIFLAFSVAASVDVVSMNEYAQHQSVSSLRARVCEESGHVCDT